MKNVLKLILCFGMIAIASCEINIDTSDDCLKCSYRIDGREISEELCDAFGTEQEMDEMRERMQMEADSLGVRLDCEKH